MNVFVSGRLCLFGEHSDWAGYHNRTNADIASGMAVVTGIEQGIHAYIEKSDCFRFRTVLPGGDRTPWQEWPLSVRKLKEVAQSGVFFSYVAGVAAFMLEYYDVGGLSIDCFEVTVPMKRGLSSSAAVCVLVARAFNLLYGLQIAAPGEMEAAYRGEILTPSRCGRLDQACAFGGKPVLMHFIGEEMAVERLRVGMDLHWVFAGLGGEKDTRKILSALNACYPFAQTPLARGVQRALGEENRRIVSQVVEALVEGDAWRLGALMTEAQGIFDALVAPACPEELTAFRLHAALSDPTARALSLGGKGVGSQGDGSVQFICADAAAKQALCAHLQSQGMEAFPLTIRAQPGDGEIQLTSALDAVCRADGMMANRVGGKRFDIGLPEAYRETVWRFGRQL
ncbi:MAG TPA: GHMP kinase [Clostridia bacterium]|nr:GHMP kinase [Clostridia bacterium]